MSVMYNTIYENEYTTAKLDKVRGIVWMKGHRAVSDSDWSLFSIREIDAIHARLHADDEPQAEQPVERETCGGCRYGGHFYEDNFEDTYGTCFVDGKRETEVHIDRPACRHYRPRKES